MDAKVKVLSLSGSENGTDLSCGLGARFNFYEKVSVRGEYEVVDADELDRSDFMSMGIEFNFNYKKISRIKMLAHSKNMVRVFYGHIIYLGYYSVVILSNLGGIQFQTSPIPLKRMQQ